MAKSTKNAPSKPARPITDFFARLPSSSQGSNGSLSASGRPRFKRDSPTASQSKNNGPQTSQGSSGGAKEVQDSSLKIKDPNRLEPPAPSTKRGRSSTMQSVTANGQSKSQNLSQGASTTTPRKKPRLSSPISMASTPSCVPSSQSDENELVPSILVTQKADALEAVQHWRTEAQLPTPDGLNESLSTDMDADEPAFTENHSRHATPTTNDWSFSPIKKPPTNQVFTPPLTDGSSDDIGTLPDMPPTPMALDAETKTKRIIEEIKARAYAEACSSPEPIIFDVPDELSDDSSDEDALPLFVPSKFTASSSSDSACLRRSSRNLPRLSGPTRDGSPVPRASQNARASSSKMSPPLYGKKLKPAKNPVLEMLLKEKASAEKKGKGAEVLLSADILLGKSSLLDEMTLEDMDHKSWDYDKLKNMETASLPWDQNFNEIDNVFLDESAKKDLFGNDTVAGDDINDIIAKERLALHTEGAEEAPGVPLWSGGEGDATVMAVDNPLSFRYSGNSATLTLLSNAVEQDDVPKAVFILKSGVFAALKLGMEPEVVNQLCRLALNSKDQTLSDAAFQAVLQVMNREDLCQEWRLSSTLIFEILLQLGAQREALEAADLAPVSTSVSVSFKSPDREDVLYRLVTIIRHAARFRCLTPEAVAEVVVSLILIALEPSISHQLRRETVSSINLACHRLSTKQHRNLECQLASRIVRLTEKQRVVNKTFIISFLFAGTGNTLRIARVVADMMIKQLPAEFVQPGMYRDAPSLPELLKVLKQEKTNTTGVFQINEDTNYSHLKEYIYTLGVALSNIEGHVEEQKTTKIRPASTILGFISPPQSPTKHGEKKPDSDLQLMYSALETLHGQIDDFRAAHIDRSRAKTVLKQLQMCIHYQRLTYEKAWKDRLTERMSVKNWLAKSRA